MDFYYIKFSSEAAAGIVEKIENDILYYMPYRSFSHLELVRDLDAGNECECFLEDGRKITVDKIDGYGKLKIKT